MSRAFRSRPIDRRESRHVSPIGSYEVRRLMWLDDVHAASILSRLVWRVSPNDHNREGMRSAGRPWPCAEVRGPRRHGTDTRALSRRSTDLPGWMAAAELRVNHSARGSTNATHDHRHPGGHGACPGRRGSGSRQGIRAAVRRRRGVPHLRQSRRVDPGTGRDPIATFENSTNPDQLSVAGVSPGNGAHGGRWAVHHATFLAGADANTLVTSWAQLMDLVGDGQIMLVRDEAADFRCPIIPNG